MFTQAKMILKSYFPIKLEKGMWFLVMHHGQMSVYELGYDIHHEEQKELYLQLNGAPVEPYIYLEGNPNVPDETSLMAEPENIGWFDEGEHSDEMHDITIREINMILDNGGHCEIEVEEEHIDDDEASDYIKVVPVLFQDKIIIRYDNDDVALDYDDDEDDYNICGACNGSGEGMTEDSSCPICGGSGEIDDDEEDDEEGDWEHHSHYNF